MPRVHSHKKDDTNRKESQAPRNRSNLAPQAHRQQTTIKFSRRFSRELFSAAPRPAATGPSQLKIWQHHHQISAQIIRMLKARSHPPVPGQRFTKDEFGPLKKLRQTITNNEGGGNKKYADKNAELPPGVHGLNKRKIQKRRLHEFSDKSLDAQRRIQTHDHGKKIDQNKNPYGTPQRMGRRLK